MFDLAVDTTSHQIIREFYEANKIVSAVCHGPVALLNVKLSDGAYLIKDTPITGFTNEEEDILHASSAVPFLLETELNKISGGKFVKAEPWAEKVVVSGRIITGQNPASATAVGQAILKAISA